MGRNVMPTMKITTPVRCGRESGAEGSDGQGKKLALLPGNVAESRRVPADVDDHGDQGHGGAGT